MDWNGHLSISDRSLLRSARTSLAPTRNFVSWISAAAALAAALALNTLPLQFFLLIALTLVCILLLPRTPLSMLVILLVLSPLRTLIATESSLALPLDIGQILLALYLAVWLADAIIRRCPLPSLPAEPVFLSAVGLCIVLAVGVWTSASISNWLTEWLKWVGIALLVWILSQTARANWTWLIVAVLASATANAIVGLYIFFGGSGADHLVILGRYFRAFGTFGQPNPFGGFMGIALPLAMMCALAKVYQIALSFRAGRRPASSRVAALAIITLVFAILLAALLASWSRGAWLGFAASLVVMLIAFPRRLAKGISYAIALAALFLSMWFVGLLPRSVVSRLTTAATDLITVSDVRGIEFYPWNYAVVERIAHWQAAVSMAQAHPFVGVGLGNYAEVYEDYRLINWEEALGHAHNLYLNFLAETGVVGLLAYLAFWLIIFRVTWTTRRHPDWSARALAVGLLGCWTYIAVHSIFDNLFVNNLFLHVGVLLSVLAILHRQVSHSLEVE
ncbi:MAG: O-antigen ligase family protein [Chloroflexi bacterium]|nr:O-antigen ligase family protein [Chloroflexota bacterium]